MGFDLSKWLAIAKEIAPIALRATGVPLNIIGDVSKGIMAAQSLQVPGADKKSSVVDIAEASLDAAGVTGDAKVYALAAVDDGIDTAVALVNVAHKHAVGA